MDITTLAAAQESIKALFLLAKGATAAAVDHELKGRLIEIQGAILDTQSKLGDAQAERLELLHQVAVLREQVRQNEVAKAALDSYTLHEVEPGKYLYRYSNDEQTCVEHFACPSCHNAGKVTVLQSKKLGTQQFHYWCQTCKFALTVGPSDPPLPVRRSATPQRNW